MRFGAAALPPGQPDLQVLMRTFAARNSPWLTAEQLGGAHTGNTAYYSRGALPGCRSAQALVLDAVCWLDIGGEFQVRDPTFVCFFLPAAGRSFKNGRCLHIGTGPVEAMRSVKSQ